MTTTDSTLTTPLAHRLVLVAVVLCLHLLLFSSLHAVAHISRAPHTITINIRAAGKALNSSPPSPINPRPAQAQAVRTSAMPSESASADAAVPSQTDGASAVVVAASPLADCEPDFQAAYLNNPAPIYPMAARRMGWQGKVLVSVEVRADGRAGQVQVQQSSGHQVLDEAALRAVRNWRFSPARQAGQLIDKRFLIPIPFVLKELE